MKGVLLCGGLGTRLRPLTTAINKHALPVFNKPMCHYGLEMLAEAGIKEVMMVVGGQSTEVLMKMCKDGKEFGLERLYYVYQEGEGGIAAALALTEQFVGQDDVCVVLGDNIIVGDSLANYVPQLKVNQWIDGAWVFIAPVSDPQNYGVPTFDDQKRILYITEKPEKPFSNYAVIGVYIYGPDVFEKIKTCKPSGRGELEISDVNNLYAEEGHLHYQKVKGKWLDAGSSIEAWVTAGKIVEESQVAETI
jgi:glucose-1-phosphate thymidylyltransferase